MLGATGDLAQGLGERLALDERDVQCDLLGTLAQQRAAAVLEPATPPPVLRW
jgi:hypothetical protein